MKSLLLSIFSVSAVTAVTTEDVNRPVAKVLTLLKEMKSTLEKEQKDDIEMFEKMACWCKTNKSEKDEAVEAAQTKIEKLKADIEEYTAQIAELETSIEQAKKDIAKDQKALAEATALRAKENEAFLAEEKDMVETIATLKNAVAALGGVHGALIQKNVKPVLMQVQKKVAPMVNNSKYADIMRKDLWAVLGAFNEDTPVQQHELSATQVFSEMFNGPAPKKAFLQSSDQPQVGAGSLNAAGETGAYDEAMAAKAAEAEKQKHLAMSGTEGVKSYNSQSGAIFGILQQMQEDFETKLKNAREEEAAAFSAFKKMEAALLGEIKSTTEKMNAEKTELADTKSKLSQATKDKKATTAALDADQQFLIDLEEQCSTSEEEHNARVKERGDEITAIGEAMGILTADESRDLFTKTFNFIQLKSVTRAKSQMKKLRARASKLILEQARRTGNYHLAALAISAKLDGFVKVKKAMDDMLAELNRQQKEEYELKETCNKDIDRVEDDISDKTKLAEDTQSTITDLAGQIDTLKKEIDVLNVQIVDTQTAIKAAGEDRAEENKEFQSTVNDQRMTVVILNKALDKLKGFYEKGESLIQEPGKANSAPPKQAKYKQAGGAPGAMGLIEMIIMDAKQLEKEALAMEQKAQAEYAKFVTNSNKSIASYQSQVEANSVAKAKNEADKAQNEATLSDTEKMLEDLKAEEAAHHKKCDFTLKNYDITQEARAQEMEAIGQAKAVLSGADFA